MQPKNNVQIPEYLLVKHTLRSPNIKDSSKKKNNPYYVSHTDLHTIQNCLALMMTRKKPTNPRK